MSVDQIANESARRDADPSDARPGTATYSVDQLAHKVGMSPRNIRAHQARKLLPPPVRKGRVACYDDGHVRRLESIKALQRQGFNLVSIEAMLGVRGADNGTDGLTVMLARLGAERPSLIHALIRHQVVGRGADGMLRVIRPRAVRSALDLHRVGMGTVPSLQVLSEVLDSLRPIADELLAAVSARMVALAPGVVRSAGRSWDELDDDVLLLTQGLIGLLAEAFRAAVETRAEEHVTTLIDEQSDLGLQIEDVTLLDNG
ncbi:MerR family transcriptional regulator [Solwaraspora sp. WMMD937]|uniref:MerR family transcriptional regulator n=1 Tax=Solwaraspora sp. WMMD937 TaxID=3016090 RepID=UPI00249AAE5D|nr:MerR family transcriptional regulator [Solwaraspora sp. WMMD937]WFE22199.1 MerR family transcriptional regulator [Solwaraspora sp. WMMD937]